MYQKLIMMHLQHYAAVELAVETEEYFVLPELPIGTVCHSGIQMHSETSFQTSGLFIQRYSSQHCLHLAEPILYFSRLTTSCLMSHHIFCKDRKVTYPHPASFKACSPKATENNSQLCSRVLSQLRPTEFFTRDIFSGNVSKNCHRITEA